MESSISDEITENDMKTMKDQLSEFGLGDENLSKEEMSDLLKALNNSKSSAHDDEVMRQKTDVIKSPVKTLKRHYVDVVDRRMPWSLLPNDITPAQKVRVLAVYIKHNSLNKYRQARMVPTFAQWPAPLQIVEELARSQTLRSTRSGRSVPVYADIDDDSSDIDFIVTKPKKRKTENDGIYSNKVISLKRKSSKDDNSKLLKEIKLSDDNVDHDVKKSDNFLAD